MPTSIGHAVAGVAAAWAADLSPGHRPVATPSTWYQRLGGGLMLTCAGLAALPDADLLFHAHRTVTHSIGAVILVTIIAAAVTGQVTHGDRARIARVALMCGGAYASHLLLDWLAMDRYPPYGIQALWPFSSAWYISNLDWFPQVARRAFFTWPVVRYNAWVVAQECLRLGPILIVVGLFRARAVFRRP